MAPGSNKARKAQNKRGEIRPKQRMIYVTVRIGELNAELERLKAERTALREKIRAERGQRKSAGGAENAEDD